MDSPKMSKELFDQISKIAKLDYEENKDKFTFLHPKDIFIFSYIQGFRDAFASYEAYEKESLSEVYIGDIITEIPSEIINISVSGSEREYKKYDEKIKSMELKDVYTLGFQLGFEKGFDIYSNGDLINRNKSERIKYYHANFDRLH